LYILPLTQCDMPLYLPDTHRNTQGLNIMFLYLLIAAPFILVVLIPVVMLLSVVFTGRSEANMHDDG
jgi:hypothetical protein